MTDNADLPPELNLPLPRQDQYSTWEVLKHEFNLLHGMSGWNPDPLPGETTREDMIADACRNGVGDMVAATETATYAWSVLRLGCPKLQSAGQTALCLSGGGIRSAAFGLGILQGLAKAGLLDQFHYLSSVSGGGYIASWLTAWRTREDFKTVLTRLRARSLGEFAEPEPLQRLRFNQNFLTPKVGLVSADTWATLTAILRNLILNWLVFLPLIAAILLVPRLVQAGFVLLAQQDPRPSLLAVFGRVLPAGVGEPMHTVDELIDWRSWTDSAAIVLILMGFTISAYNRPANGLTSMTQTRFVSFVVTPAFVGAILLSAATASWLDKLTGTPIELIRWVILGALVYLVGRIGAAAITIFRFGLYGSTMALKATWLVAEILAWGAAGAFAGLLAGVGAQYYAAHVKSYLADDLINHVQEISRVMAVCGPPWVVASFLAGEVIYVGITSRLPSGDRDREWLARAAGWFGITAAIYLFFSWVVLYGWQTVQQAQLATEYLVTVGGLGFISIISALLPLTRATTKSDGQETVPITAIIAFLSGLFVLGISAALAEAILHVLNPLCPITARMLHWWGMTVNQISESSDRAFQPTPEFLFLLVLALVLVGISQLISVFVNVNLFSLHALYRNRLIKAFLGASNIGVDRQAEGRNAFDGFSEKDNLALADVHPAIVSQRRKNGEGSLYPVLSMSINLTATQNLAWQERKAGPFIATPLYTGGHKVGYRPSWEFATGLDKVPNSHGGLSLGTAMAVSGAAVSPNWGYHSAPLTGFLMMLANVRLGWWFGNPKSKSGTWRSRGPHSSLKLFVQEALGWTDDHEPWIYLSDGGHFENLGLYEMVRRRCRTIVVVDAGADPNCTLEDLGNAVRKISIDLGVKVEFRRILVRKRSDVAAAGVYCAVGDIDYPEGGMGNLIYIKPGFYGSQEPADVRAYAASNAKFPHETTMDQWFSESQFESYRALGAYVIEELCGEGAPPQNLYEFSQHVKDYVAHYETLYDTGGAVLVDIRRTVRVAPELPQRRVG